MDFKDHLSEHLMFFFAVFVLVVLTIVVFLSTEARGSYYNFFFRPSLSSLGCLRVSLMLFLIQVPLYADYSITNLRDPRS